MDKRAEREIRSEGQQRSTLFNSLKTSLSEGRWIALIITVLTVAPALTGCKTRSAKENFAARVFDKELTWKEVYEVVPDGASPEDSVFTSENFINNWVRQQVMVHHAEQNLNEEQKDFSRQLEDYRNSLITFAFEEEYIRQKLDTTVSEEEIAAYYEQNQDNFLLKDYIVRANFCILDKETPRLRKFEKLFYSDDPEDLTDLEEFCVEYKANYFLNDEKWLYFDDLIKQIPLEDYNTESFLKKNKNVRFEKGNNIYYLTLLEYKLKDSVSPLSFQRDKIRNIIINQRKVALLNKLRDAIYAEALAKQNIEINRSK